MCEWKGSDDGYGDGGGGGGDEVKLLLQMVSLQMVSLLIIFRL